eukprot:gb/GECH01011075.1/.p1 GENE.gb/GECH01011075.1/~~gb/GECH01011075.1/.p1  ORF type:complete len:125 (+),score=31.03 gb/GECH01011075.1/:1-375(+)
MKLLPTICFLVLCGLIAMVTSSLPSCPGRLFGPFERRMYCLLDEEGSENAQRDACRNLNWQLSSVNNTQEFSFLAKEVDRVAYVNSWQGDDYKDVCIAFYPGGAIVEPPVGCNGPLSGLCEFMV